MGQHQCNWDEKANLSLSASIFGKLVPKITARTGAQEKPALCKHSTFFIGLDLGDTFSLLALLDRNGDFLETFRLSTTHRALQCKLFRMPHSCIAQKVGTHLCRVKQLLRALAKVVVVPNHIFLNENGTGPNATQQTWRSQIARSALHSWRARGSSCEPVTEW